MSSRVAQQEIVVDAALLETGWARDVALTVSEGRIAAIQVGSEAPDAERIRGIALPGLVNLHSIGIDRPLAGFCQRGGESEDSRRELRRRFLGSLTPDDVEVIAALAQIEMLEGGFTAAAEFQYLHLAPDGRRYENVAELNQRVVAAAAATGIGLTLLPVFQNHGGLGPRPAEHFQRRFALEPDAFRAVVAATQVAAAAVPGTVVGLGVQSLRTVTIGTIRELAADFPTAPIHLPVASNDDEIAECLAVTGARPLDHLLDWVPVDGRWCLIHATYLSPEERARLIATQAVAGVVPCDEADRAETGFDTARHYDGGGLFGIGTGGNSQAGVAATLRQLEYGQRQRSRTIGGVAAIGQSTARALFDMARLGGARATGRPLPVLAPDAPADFVVLDAAHPAMVARQGDRWLDGWVFGTDRPIVREVWVGGRHVVAGGRHIARDDVEARYLATAERLLSAL